MKLGLLAVCLWSICKTTAQDCTNPRWPSPALDRTETLLYEGVTQGAFNLTTLVANCRLIRSFSTIAAEWVRLAYHDMAHHNVDDGTGGIDYSIGFELDRPENVGSGLTSSLSDYKPAASPYISMSDLIAMGVVMATVGCGGPMIPYRAGRMDSYKAGSSGVPQPHEDLATHIESFRRQGFSSTEMIELVACGHTIGGVRNPDFPDIVPPRGQNSTGIVFFDSTHQRFDHMVVEQYLNGSTQNPLVIHSNETVRSDFRVFNSDGNQTMQRMASPEAFSKICGARFERMINTVPAGVHLTEVVEPIQYKIDPVLWSVGSDSLIMKTGLRILDPSDNPSRTVSIFWKEKRGEACTRETCSLQTSASKNVWGMILSKLGHTAARYEMSIPINATTSISEFWFEIDENDGSEPIVVNNDGCRYRFSEMEDLLFFDVGRSFDHDSPAETVFVVAARTDARPSQITVETYSMVSQSTPLIESWEAQLNSNISPTLGYEFWTANIPFRIGISSLGVFTVHGVLDSVKRSTEIYDRGIIQMIF